MRYFTLFILTLLCTTNGYAQIITKEFTKDSVANYLTNTTSVVNKQIPSELETVIKLALLYYPELVNTHIKVCVKKQSSALTARPTLLAIFQKPANRKYIITISNKVAPQFTPILLSNLSFNAQVGVIGHELSHIADYSSKPRAYFATLLRIQLSQNTINKFEYATDMRCIAHGLGYQLLAWSTEVRYKLNIAQWKGIKQMNKPGNERYMNPESIKRVMGESKLYN